MVALAVTRTPRVQVETKKTSHILAKRQIPTRTRRRRSAHILYIGKTGDLMCIIASMVARHDPVGSQRVINANMQKVDWFIFGLYVRFWTLF